VEVRTLRPLRGELQRQRTFPYVGQWLPSTRVATVHGDSVMLAESAPGRAQVLLGFTTTCPYCRESLPRWRQLADQLQNRSAVELFWVSGSTWDSTRAWLAREQVPGQVVRLPNAKLQRVFRFHTVPLTVVLDRYGRVVYRHSGAVRSDAVIDSVLDAISRATAAEGSIAVSTPLPNGPR
jgi:peroxiredoxin